MTVVLEPEAPAIETIPEPGTIAYEAHRMDRLFPGWWENIDEEALDMPDAHACVLGQGMGHYEQGIQAIYDDEQRTGVVRASHAYCCNWREDIELDVRAAWIEEVERRRAA